MNYNYCPYQINPEDYPANEIDPCEFCPLDKCPISEPHKLPNAVELISMLTAIRREIQPVSNDDNCTVVANCKPDSLKFVIDECLDYISRNDILIF